MWSPAYLCTLLLCCWLCCCSGLLVYETICERLSRALVMSRLALPACAACVLPVLNSTLRSAAQCASVQPQTACGDPRPDHVPRPTSGLLKILRKSFTMSPRPALGGGRGLTHGFWALLGLRPARTWLLERDRAMLYCRNALGGGIGSVVRS